MQRDYSMIETKLSKVATAVKNGKSNQALQLITKLINELRGE